MKDKVTCVGLREGQRKKNNFRRLQGGPTKVTFSFVDLTGQRKIRDLSPTARPPHCAHAPTFILCWPTPHSLRSPALAPAPARRAPTLRCPSSRTALPVIYCTPAVQRPSSQTPSEIRHAPALHHARVKAAHPGPQLPGHHRARPSWCYSSIPVHLSCPVTTTPIPGCTLPRPSVPVPVLLTSAFLPQ
jgi:hypothetical protein